MAFVAWCRGFWRCFRQHWPTGYFEARNKQLATVSIYSNVTTYNYIETNINSLFEIVINNARRRCTDEDDGVRLTSSLQRKI